MAEIRSGDRVVVQTALGEKLERIALSPEVMGSDFKIIWVCRPEELAAAKREGREPDGMPWPAEDVSPLNGAKVSR